MSGPKYLLCPGEIRSKNDGDVHFISAFKLMELYGVKSHECVVEQPWMKGTYLGAGMIRLTPRYDGNYTLPTKEAKTNG